LPKCIESLLAQSFSDWEAIIVNDGSTDDTDSICKRYVLRDSRITVINQTNQGLSAARNSGIKNSKGKWLQFVDADDYLLENCLEMAYDKLKNSSFDIVWHSGYLLVDKLGGEIWHQNRFDAASYLWDIVSKGGIGPPLSLFISKELVNEVGYFDTALSSAEDWDYWIRAGKLGAKYAVISEPLVAYRYLENSMSRSAWRMYANTKSVTMRIPEHFGSSKGFYWESKIPDMKEIHKKNILQITGLAISQGKIEEAIEFFESESQEFQLDYKPSDFALMNSFLNFRYQYGREAVAKVLNIYRPYFVEFFRLLKCDPSYNKLALGYIFERHQKNYNLFYYGTLGRLFNWWYDFDLKRQSRKWEEK
jgi:glycosyltransferase involved in cell wall biosynthesis